MQCVYVSSIILGKNHGSSLYIRSSVKRTTFSTTFILNFSTPHHFSALDIQNKMFGVHPVKLNQARPICSSVYINYKKICTIKINTIVLLSYDKGTMLSQKFEFYIILDSYNTFSNRNDTV